MNYEVILIRYGEMTLKKKNYRQFLKRVNEHVKNKCKIFPDIKYSNTDYRFYLELNGTDCDEVIKVLNTISGLYSYSLCKKVEADYQKIADISISMMTEELDGKEKTFKVETHRSDKSFPATSLEISQEIARRVLPNVKGLTVDVHNPDVVLNIDLRLEGTYVFVKTIKGLGGYPAGIAGKGLLMMSGGIDSPVAGFLSLRKGINLIAIHYASPPYTSLNSLQKVIDLLQVLANYTHNGKIDLYVIPFTKIQEEIHNKTKEVYLVTLMRRFMYKIAEKICEKENIEVIINGESIGQVASQTLESMKVVNEVTNIPIIRPLATYDKEDIIKVAKQINTFNISILPYEDCCTVFVPEHPAIKPLLNKVYLEESKCDSENLINEAITNKKIIHLDSIKKYSVYDDDFKI